MCTLPKTKATGCFDIAATPEGNSENNLGEYVHHFLMQHFIVCWKRLPQIEKNHVYNIVQNSRGGRGIFLHTI